MFVYPGKGKGSITVMEQDYERLNEGNFLNDTIVEFYTK